MKAGAAKSFSGAVMPLAVDPRKPLNLGSQDFADNKYGYYAYLRDNMPVARGRVATLKVHLLSRYEDCMALVKDPRFGRNRSHITGGSRLPFPLPKSLQMLALSMIVEDDPEHRRLRTLVQKAFAPKSLVAMQADMERMAHGLLDDVDRSVVVDLQQAYALHIPTAVIAGLVGVDQEHMPRFQNSLRMLNTGFTGWSIFRTLVWDLRKSVEFVRELIASKRRRPGEDLLTQLIEAEEDGDRLSEEELISMVFLLIVAGYETTVHLISNAVITLLQHPQQLARLRAEPALMGAAVEEVLRFLPPVHGTKMNYAREDLRIAGADIAKGDMVMPLLASANRDARMFVDPDVFDIERANNKHLSFSQGNHFCLGAFLARMETKVALSVLLQRSPDLRLAVPADTLQVAAMPGWHRYKAVPVWL